jgi:predicted ferric reductase
MPMPEHTLESTHATPVVRDRSRLRGVAVTGLAWTLLVGNTAAIVWLWWHGGNVTKVHDTGELLTSLARLTGLLGAYSALLQVLLLARIPALERLVGLDRLTVWHRWNGHACLYLILGHVAFSFYGYALMDRVSLPHEIRTMIGGGIYPGMVTATIGTVLFVVVVLSSIVVARRRLPYEWWYAVHLTAYAAIALGWFHQVPTGNELVLDTVAADYWASLYLATIGILLVFRVALPVANALRFRMYVAEVVEEGRGVVSVRIEGRRLDRLGAVGGQFFLWRFLDRGHWWRSHPFSLSASPEAGALRITVKALGDFTSEIGRIPVGTRVVAEGPFGVFTGAARSRDKVLLIGGGIGITPIRALRDELRGDVVVLHRVLSEDEAIFRDELPGAVLVAGDHATPEGARLLSPEHLLELVPDIADRDVYVCGPPAMVDATVRSVRTHVPSRHIHVERFAF